MSTAPNFVMPAPVGGLPGVAATFGGRSNGTLTSVTSFDKLDLVGTLETFPYFPFLQSSADPTAGTRSDALVLPPNIFGPLATINATTGQNRFHDAWSQEVRFTSPDDRKVRWILGGYVVEARRLAAEGDHPSSWAVRRSTPRISRSATRSTC